VWLGARVGERRLWAAPAGPPRSLLDREAAERFVAAVREVVARWAELGMPKARARALGKAANVALTWAGVPEVKGAIGSLSRPLGAQLVTKEWTIQFSIEFLQRPVLEMREAIQLLALTYHEARHAEERWLMARYSAGRGQSSATAIGGYLQIPEGIAKKAIRKPLPPGSPTAQEVRLWLESLQSGKYKRVQSRLVHACAAFDATQVASPDGGTTEAERKCRQAIEEYNKHPLEADAWKAGNMVVKILQAPKEGTP
jgi:hypothetical protein